LLAEKVVSGNEGRYDALIGIANGGVAVAREMAKIVGAPLFTVRLQRPTTKRKNRFIRSIIRHLPKAVNNTLRKLEALCYMWIRKGKSGACKSECVEIPAELEEFLHGLGNGCVLVADDAVDSGCTLRSVLTALKAMSPDVMFKSAVITVTTSSASITPDYFLYNDGTLIRFPWSMDA